MSPQPKRETSRALDALDLLRVLVARDDDLLVGLDHRVEQVEEFLLGAALAAEELDVVDQQDVERAVVPLELLEALVLVGADDVGDVGLRVGVADLGGRVLRQDVVADRLDQVRLAQPHAAVDEQRVVGRRMLGDLQRGGAGELVRLAGDEAVERQRRVEARCLRSLRGTDGRCRHTTTAAAAATDSRAVGSGGRRVSPGGAMTNSTPRSLPVASRSIVEILGPKRSFTHCRTKRFGATSRTPSAVGSQRNGRIQVANCCGGRSRSREVRQADHGSALFVEGVVRFSKAATGRRSMAPRSSSGGGQKRVPARPRRVFRPPSYAHSRGRASGYPQADGEPGTGLRIRREPVRVPRE